MTRTESQARPNFPARTLLASSHTQDSSVTPSAHIALLGGDPNFMTSLARGLAVLQDFSDRKRQMTNFSQRAGWGPCVDG